MSYAIAPALQKAVYQHLLADAALAALVGTAIHDAAPPGGTVGTYVALGPEQVRERSDKTGHGALHEITISVVSDAAGFSTAKQVAAAISDALVDASLTLERGSLVYLNFHRARARREQDAQRRRIDLIFRARVQDN